MAENDDGRFKLRQTILKKMKNICKDPLTTFLPMPMLNKRHIAKTTSCTLGDKHITIIGVMCSLEEKKQQSLFCRIVLLGYFGTKDGINLVKNITLI